MPNESSLDERKHLVIHEDAVKDLEVSEAEVAGHDERLLLAPPTRPGPSPGRHDR
jgi:hypothetical protein